MNSTFCSDMTLEDKYSFIFIRATTFLKLDSDAGNKFYSNYSITNGDIS